MGKMQRMDQVRMIISIYLSCGSIKGTAKRMQGSKNNVRFYLPQAEKQGTSLKELMKLPPSSFEAVFPSRQDSREDHRTKISNEQIDHWIKELRCRLTFYNTINNCTH